MKLTDKEQTNTEQSDGGMCKEKMTQGKEKRECWWERKVRVEGVERRPPLRWHLRQAVPELALPALSGHRSPAPFKQRLWLP